MGFGIGTFLIAVGAVLRFAVSRTFWNGVNLHTVGVILMIVGAIGLLVSLTALTTPAARRRRVVVSEDPEYDEVIHPRV